ncbi:MAG: hypothetical protein ACPHCJ_04455, partial [Oceanococcaceae bacterium]
GVAYEALAIVAMAGGNSSQAVSFAERLAAIRREEHDPAQTDTPLAIAQAGAAYALDSEPERAEALFTEAIALADSRYPEDYPTTARALWARAELRAAQGQRSLAQADRQRASRIFGAKNLAVQSAAWTFPIHAEGGSGAAELHTQPGPGHAQVPVDGGG